MSNNILGIPRQRTWLDVTHPTWDDSIKKWIYTQDHYTGEVLEKLDTYLIRRAQTETGDGYDERKKIVDYTTHFSAIIDSLGGMLFSSEAGRIKRDFGDLGDKNDRETPAGQLWEDADGTGKGWSTVFRQLATSLIVNQTEWILIDPKDDGTTRIHLVNPINVVNWITSEDGVPVEVLLRRTVDERISLMDTASGFVDEYVLYNQFGWRVFRKVKSNNNTETTVIEIDSGEYRYEDASGNLILPIFPAKLALNRMVGYAAAKKANAIMNFESNRDWILRVSNYPFLILSGGDTYITKVEEKLGKGSRVIQEDPQSGGGEGHRFISPSADPARVATDTLKRKVDELYVASFRDYGDSAIERTATEVKQNTNAGIGSFLTMLKSSVDDAEKMALLIIEQQQFSNESEKWFKASVERPDDFQPFDIASEIERTRVRFWGESGVIPVGREGELQAATKLANYVGLNLTEQQIKDGIKYKNTKEILDSVSDLPLTPEVKTTFLKILLSNILEDAEVAALEADILEEASKVIIPPPIVNPLENNEEIVEDTSNSNNDNE